MRPAAAALAPFFALLAGIGLFAATYPRPLPESAIIAPVDRPRVRLAVLVVFDQMRGDYPEKWKPLFGPGGFVRLQTEGATFTRCYYPYGTTLTAPGHASMLTGTCPDRHGIVSNNWHERADVYAAGDARWAIVPAPEPGQPDPKTGKRPAAPQGGTPERLLSETVADMLKRTYGARSKVFGLSLKDRSAILPTGKAPDGTFWFDGRFVTSTYYTDKLGRPFPKWVTAFNNSRAADRWFGRTWDRFRPDVDYTAFSGRDDGPGEGTGSKQGKTFPHDMTAGLKAPGKAYYDALAMSPYGNDLLLEFTKACVVAEELGRRDAPDLLVVSFSSNDLIGHAWGPDSHEVLDVTLRSDAQMADLLGFLDSHVGRDQYALAVTADHGICPLTEFAADHGHPDAVRIDPAELAVRAEKHLQAKFGPPADPNRKTGWLATFPFPWIYLNTKLLEATGRTRPEVARALAEFLSAQPEVHHAYTRGELAGDFPATDEVGRRVKRSFHPGRCGDVCVVLRPYCLPMNRTSTGTTHGSPHGYDAHVPLLVLGPGVVGGSRTEPVTPQAAAAILSRFLGIRPPPDAEYPVPATLER